MTRKERLLATFRGEKVDRPPVCFYELNGYDQDYDNDNPYNVYNDPSWRPLIDMVREKTDRIVLKHVPFIDRPASALDRKTKIEEYVDEEDCICKDFYFDLPDRTLVRKTKHEKDIDTIWTTEHQLKGIDDLKAWLEIPEVEDIGRPDAQYILDIEAAIGDTGIVSLDTGDALCEAAELFSMGEFTIIAMTEPELFHQLLQRIQRRKLKEVKAICDALPGRPWRIYGPEYACPPYLPPYCFKDYVLEYDKEIIDIINKSGGYPRIHAHGMIKEVLDMIVETGCMGIDPVEPEPQGNVALKYVREKYGDKLVLFGNLELNEMETLDTDMFADKVATAIEEGTFGEGKGFVLMPSAAPLGRELKKTVFDNYKKIIEVYEAYFGPIIER